MSTESRGRFIAIILGVATVSVLALVVTVAVLMQEPVQTPSTQSIKKVDIGKLPDELTADFQNTGGWWTANGPADDNAIRTLARKHPVLEKVRLNQAIVSALGYEALIGHHLDSLDLVNSETNVNSLKAISRLSGLKQLELKDRTVSDEEMAALTGPKSLERFYLEAPSVTPNGIKDLSSKFPQLNCLGLVNCRGVNDSALPYILNCRKLQSLTLIVSPISAVAVARMVKQLPIVHLCVEFQDQGAEGAKLVSMLPESKLTLLVLTGVRIDEKLVSKLVAMKRLEKLVLTRCPGSTARHIALLKRGLPNCEIAAGSKREEPEVGLID